MQNFAVCYPLGNCIANAVREEGIAQSLYYSWSKELLEAGKKRLAGDTSRAATSGEVKELRSETLALKEVVADFTLENRLLRSHDLITSPAFIVIKTSDEFKDKTTAPNQLWQTDFTYFKIIPWGWYYLSTILDDYSRYIIAWKLCTTMKANDVTDTLELALQASGCDQAKVVHKPRLLFDNGPCYISADLADLADFLHGKGMGHVRGAPNHPQTQGKIASQRCEQRLPASGDGGIKRSRTASYWKTILCRVIWSKY